MLDADGEQIEGYAYEVDDAMCEAVYSLDDRRPSLLMERAHNDAAGDPVIRISRHTGEVDSFEFDVDEMIALHGRSRTAATPADRDLDAALATHTKRTLERMHVLECLTHEAQEETNRAELYGRALATDQDTATAHTNLNEVDDFVR